MNLGRVQNKIDLSARQDSGEESSVAGSLVTGSLVTVISIKDVGRSTSSDVRTGVFSDLTHPKSAYEIARFLESLAAFFKAMLQNTYFGIVKFCKGAAPIINVFDVFVAVFGLVGKASSFVDAAKQRKQESGKKLANGVYSFKVSVTYAGVQLSCAVLDLTAKVLSMIRWLGELKFHNMSRAVMGKLGLVGESLGVVRYTLKSIFAINEIRDSSKIMKSTMLFADTSKALYKVHEETAKDIAKTNRRQYVVKLVETVTLLAIAVLGLTAFFSAALVASPALPWVFTALGTIVLSTTIAGSIYKAIVKHKIQNAICAAGFVVTHKNKVQKTIEESNESPLFVEEVDGSSSGNDGGINAGEIGVHSSPEDDVSKIVIGVN